MNPAPSQVIDSKYQLLRQLGQGGMGAVYEARHLGTNRRVAVKVIATQALQAGHDIVRRFQLEARASGAIESDHVVQVLDTGVDPATQSPYMVMELLNGEDVQQLVRRIGPLPVDVALRIVAQAALGLRRAHDAGIIHRDIKTANLYLAKHDSADITVKLLDFGIAKVRVDELMASGDHGLTRTGAMLGSPLYMSPEQAKGLKDLDARADIWSLGVVLHEVLAGLPPNHEVTNLGALIVAICAATQKPVQDEAPWVPPEVAAIVHKARAPERSNRYQSAAEMYDAIVSLLPNGASLRESMLVPMSASARAVVAPRYQPPTSAVTGTGPHSPLAASIAISSPVASSPHAAAISGVSGSTTAGFGTSSLAGPGPSRFRWLIPGVVVGVVGFVGAGLALKNGARSSAPELPIAATAAPSVTPIQEKAVTLKELVDVPPDVTAEVDGVLHEVKSGKLEISGDLGSAHDVVLIRGPKKLPATRVAITESGPIPARLDFPVATVAVGVTPTRVVTGRSTPPPPTTVEAQPPPPATHAPTNRGGGTPQVDRSM